MRLVRIERVSDRMSWQRTLGVGVALVALLAGGTPARAAEITTPPLISGEPKVDAMLVGHAGEWRPPSVTPTFEWMRCTAAGTECAPIAGAVGLAYVVVPADALRSLVLRQTLETKAATVFRDSAPTPVIEPREEAPSPAPAALANLAPPSVFGSPAVGHTLAAFPGLWSSGQAIDFLYQWRRCPVQGSCADIAGASQPAYEVGLDDVGNHLRVRVIAVSGDQEEARESPLTAVVRPDEVASPGVSPEASTPERESGAFSEPGPATTMPPLPAPPPRAQGHRLMSPFPIIRIRGRFSVRSTRFTLVTVRASRRARLAVSCRRGCSFRRRDLRASPGGLTRLRGLERRLPPGARIVLRVTQPGRIGKYTRIDVRGGRPPARRDACLMPGGARPVRCPAS
jgi:hypothetical protein